MMWPRCPGRGMAGESGGGAVVSVKPRMIYPDRGAKMAMCRQPPAGASDAASGSGSSRPDGQKDMSKTTTTAKMRADGTIVEMMSDGSEATRSGHADAGMTEVEIAAAAAADPDARPMTSEEIARARRLPRVKTLRRALGLTQEQFAARYHIPLATLRDWEQGRTEPDETARAYLKVIASNPEWVSRALTSGPQQV